jgi:hypothetical protein
MGHAAAAAVALPAALLTALPVARRRLALAASALVIGAWPFVGSSGSFSLARAHGAERVAGQRLAELPARARLHLSYFQTTFAFWYQRAVEGARPDVDQLDIHFRGNPGYAPKLRTGGPRVWEYDLYTPPEIAASLAPLGLLYRQAAGAADFTAQDAAWARLQDRLAAEGDLADRETRNDMLWLYYLGATLRCLTGHAEAARSAEARARALNGGDTPELAALRKRCAP